MGVYRREHNTLLMCTVRYLFFASIAIVGSVIYSFSYLIRALYRCVFKHNKRYDRS